MNLEKDLTLCRSISAHNPSDVAPLLSCARILRILFLGIDMESKQRYKEVIKGEGLRHTAKVFGAR